MKTVIQELFIDPPLAIARLGGSSIPQDAYSWIPRRDWRLVSLGRTLRTP